MERTRDPHYLPSNVHEIDNYGGGGLMVWSEQAPSFITVRRKGSVTGVRYRDEVLGLYVYFNRDECVFGLESILNDTNARPHRSLLVNEFLDSENIRSMDRQAGLQTSTL
ncbi:transposable element Tcb2 transposase [Trichonephila clavipes]|nr:transposable element Tcb2 transposase [Trichonephila clavipes]